MKPKALFVMLILWLSFTTIQARSTEDVPDKGTYAKFLLVGCYMKPDEEGVRMYRFDGQTADVDYPCGLKGISNPAFLTSDSTGNRIYAIGDDEGKSSTANALLLIRKVVCCLCLTRNLQTVNFLFILLSVQRNTLF